MSVSAVSNGGPNTPTSASSILSPTPRVPLPPVSSFYIPSTPTTVSVTPSSVPNASFFMPPPPLPMFQSPAGQGKRYSIADALATPSVQRRADAEATVYQPLAGTHGKMFDESRVLIEDYTGTPTSTPGLPPPFAATNGHYHQTMLTNTKPRSNGYSHTLPSPVSVASSSLSTHGYSSTLMVDSHGHPALHPHGIAIVSPSSKPSSSSTSVSTTPRGTTVSQGTSVASEEPDIQVVSPPPNQLTPDPNMSYPIPTRTISSNTAGAFDLPIACGYIPLPSSDDLGDMSVDDLYDRHLTNRGREWLRCLNPLDLRRRFAPGMYLKLLSTGCINDAENQSEHSNRIRKDLTRTFPDYILFQSNYGKSVLYNILRAYSAYDMPVGYSQGLAFIAGMLMLHFGSPTKMTEMIQSLDPNAAPADLISPTANSSSSTMTLPDPYSDLSSSITSSTPSVTSGAASEEYIFWSFVQLMHGRKHNLRSIYTDDCIGLKSLLSVFHDALKQLDPQLFGHLQREGVEVSLFATQWFICVFTYRFPLEFSSLIWDHFLNIGLVFLVQMAIQLLNYTKASLMVKKFDQIVPFLTNLPQLPLDLPDRAFAEVDLPVQLVEKINGKYASTNSFKKNTKKR